MKVQARWDPGNILVRGSTGVEAHACFNVVEKGTLVEPESASGAEDAVQEGAGRCAGGLRPSGLLTTFLTFRW